uniref:Uncharacterized protein n=1 Tax=Panagrolaimus superbus TaxID=310955 RepID=A0A914Y5D6_9BILA
MEQSIYQQNDDHENSDTENIPQHAIHQNEAPLSPPASPTELLSPESPIQKAQDVMVNSFYPGAEHDEPPRLPSPDPNESVEERSHEEHVERDPIQAHDQTFEPGFISSSSHNVEEHRYEEETSEQQHNGIQDDENLEPPLSNRSLESFQRHEEEVAADIQHDNDVSSYNDNVADLEEDNY